MPSWSRQRQLWLLLMAESPRVCQSIVLKRMNTVLEVNSHEPMFKTSLSTHTSSYMNWNSVSVLSLHVTPVWSHDSLISTPLQEAQHFMWQIIKGQLFGSWNLLVSVTLCQPLSGITVCRDVMQGWRVILYKRNDGSVYCQNMRCANTLDSYIGCACTFYLI